MKFSKSELNTVGHSEALAPWLFCQVKRIWKRWKQLAKQMDTNDLTSMAASKQIQ